MAARLSQEKHYYIAPEKLRDKYQHYFDRVKSLTKAIESCRRTTITVSSKPNGTIEFIVIGGTNGVNRTLDDVKYEFEKGQEVPGRISRAKKSFLSEGDQRRLQQEGRVCLLTTEALRRHDMLTGATELRQFACLRCNHPWWKHVSRIKPVSTCNHCHVRYDALDRDKEFGIGRYICEPCENTFYAWCDATKLLECYGCNSLTGPPFISPRFKPLRDHTVVMSGPKPAPRTIMHVSTPHQSTGSTISSCAITEDLGSDIHVYLQRLYPMSGADNSPSNSSIPSDSSIPSASSIPSTSSIPSASSVSNSPAGNSPPSSSLVLHFEHESSDGEVSEVELPDKMASPGYLTGDVSALDSLGAGSASTLWSSDAFDENREVSRKRIEASDSDSDGTSEVELSAPDSESGECEWPCVGDSG